MRISIDSLSSRTALPKSDAAPFRQEGCVFVAKLPIRALQVNLCYETGQSRAGTYVVESGLDEYELVIDPFLGSATTAVAAKRLKRPFVGCGERVDAVNTALNRLA